MIKIEQTRNDKKDENYRTFSAGNDEPQFKTETLDALGMCYGVRYPGSPRKTMTKEMRMRAK